MSTYPTTSKHKSTSVRPSTTQVRNLHKHNGETSIFFILFISEIILGNHNYVGDRNCATLIAQSTNAEAANEGRTHICETAFLRVKVGVTDAAAQPHLAERITSESQRLTHLEERSL